MSGSIVKLKVTTANNQISVKSVIPAINRFSVRTSQNILKVGAIVAGPKGSQGQPGAPGEPGADGNGDKSFEQDFTTQTSVTVTHNLGKYPSVLVIDSAGDQCEGSVDHLSLNQLVVSFSSSFSGKVTCN